MYFHFYNMLVSISTNTDVGMLTIDFWIVPPTSSYCKTQYHRRKLEIFIYMEAKTVFVPGCKHAAMMLFEVVHFNMGVLGFDSLLKTASSGY